MQIVRSDWTIREVYVDAQSGAIVRSINGIHSQAAIGQGNGVFGALRKLSTNQTSSTYQAVDKLRPAQGFTLAFPGTLSRLNKFFNTGVLFNSDIATDSDNAWNDGPTVDAHAYQGRVYDYYFTRFGRTGMDDRQHRSGQHRPPAGAIGSEPATARIVARSSTTRSTAATGLLVFGDGDGTGLHLPRRRVRRHGPRVDPRRHRFHLRLIYQDESGALNEAFSDIMGAAMEFFYQPVGNGRDQADWLIAEEVYLLSSGISALAQQSRSRAASPTITACGGSSARDR